MSLESRSSREQFKFLDLARNNRLEQVVQMLELEGTKFSVHYDYDTQHRLRIEEDGVDYYFDGETGVFDGTGVVCKVSDLPRMLHEMRNIHRVSRALQAWCSHS